jgi:hypothetical protein
MTTARTDASDASSRGDQDVQSVRDIDSDRDIDEAEEESFPGSDPPSSWSGPDDGPHPPAPAQPSEVEVPEAVPEADDPSTVEGWEQAEGMDGQAPTG